MQDPQISNVHLVGSVPVPTAEECFRTVCTSLPGRLKRIPDGEPGKRDTFINWQLDVLKQYDPRVVHEHFTSSSPTTSSTDEATDILKRFENYNTQYDDFALESYAIFKKLKDDGVIPRNVRFQVCLPTPVCVVYTVRTNLQSRLEPLYQEAMLRSLKRIQDSIPHAELSIQWDAPIEMGMLAEADFYGFGLMKAWFEPVFEGVLMRLAKLTEAIAEDVEVGIHLCYGDLHHKHFLEPTSSLAMVELSNALTERCKRPINWIHMPVPKDRTGREYYEPLQQLKLKNTELVLGLVHYNDEEGTIARVQAAGKFVKSFSISTECGMGRTAPEQLENILSILASVSSPTKL